MTFATITFMSSIFRRKVTFSALIPRDNEFGERINFEEGKPLKTVYLLHGHTGDCTDLVNYSKVHECHPVKIISIWMMLTRRNFGAILSEKS